MKKVAVLLVCALFGLKCLIANPVLDPSVKITELMFDSEKGWMLELECCNESRCTFVKMTVSSSLGSAESKYLPVWDENETRCKLFVLTRDGMESELGINPLGDKITVSIEFLREERIEDYDDTFIIYGNYSDSQIAAPLEGQSIGYIATDPDYFMRHYAKTNEPTMGEENDALKMVGTLTGKIYDKDNQLLLSNETMKFLTFSKYFSQPTPVENGIYSFNVFANRFNCNHILLSNKIIKIKPINMDIEPDAIIEQNIYLLEDYTAIDETDNSDKISDFPIRIYPNPLSGGQVLQYEVGTPVKSLDCRMELVSMGGKVIFESKITDYTGSINLPQTLTNGIYIVNFKLNNKTHYSTRLIISK